MCTNRLLEPSNATRRSILKSESDDQFLENTRDAGSPRPKARRKKKTFGRKRKKKEAGTASEEQGLEGRLAR